jgi:branched-chain amino acid transport system substrate-binding protein
MQITKHLATGLILGFAIQAYAAEPIKIAVTGPYTSSSSPMGLSMLAGVRLAAGEINQGGGLFGRPIELVERDDKSDPETGKLIVQELIEKDKVVAALGFANTGVALAAQRLYQNAKIPVINNVSTGAKITGQFQPPEFPENYIFRNSASDTIQSQMIVREAVEKRNLKKVAIFHDTTAYGEQGRELLLEQLDKRNLKPVAIESFKLGVSNLSDALKRAKDAGAEAILTYAIGPELATIANGRAKMGWMPPMIGSWALSLPNFIEAAGKNGEGARMPQTFIEEANNSRRTSFILAYHNANKTKQIPSAVSAAQGYDSFLLLVGAMIQAKSVEGPKVREALENLAKPVYGVITTYDKPFSASDHEALTQNMLVMGEVKQGKISYAYADEEKRSLLIHKKTSK